MITTISNFLSATECQELANWINANHFNFVNANMGGRRKTTRYLKNNVEFPAIAADLRNRIKTRLGLKDVVRPPFVQGMVASYAEPGDTCYEHVDPEWFEGHHTLHCNVIVQKPAAGGNVVIEGQEYDMPQGDLICYYVSNLKHSVTEVFGGIPRLMWIFAFCVEKDPHVQH